MPITESWVHGTARLPLPVTPPVRTLDVLLIDPHRKLRSPASWCAVRWIRRVPPNPHFVVAWREDGSQDDILYWLGRLNIPVLVLHPAECMPRGDLESRCLTWACTCDSGAALSLFVGAALIPAAYHGVVSVDYADYAGHLCGPGTVAAASASGPDLATAWSVLSEKITGWEPARDGDFFTAHLSTPIHTVDMDGFDGLFRSIDSVAPLGMVLPAWTIHRKSTTVVTVLKVARR